MQYVIKTTDGQSYVGEFELTDSDSRREFTEILGRVGLNLKDGVTLVVQIGKSIIAFNTESTVIVDTSVYYFKAAIKAICEELNMGCPVGIQVIKDNLTTFGE